MAPIRVGIIGLSPSGFWAASAHLPYLEQSSKYAITALCNSSKAAAEAAIKHFKLPQTTAAYGSPEDLAADPNVDLVVCTVRLDRHYETLRPAIMAGKDCFSEWPLALKMEHVRELHDLAKQSGAKTMVGLQGRAAPFYWKVKEIIDSGRIGKVLSTTIVAHAINAGPTDTEIFSFLYTKEIGATILNIHFAHMIDSMLLTLGELEAFSSLIATQRKKVDILDRSGKVSETLDMATPDQILLQGRLESGAMLSAHERGGKPFKDEPGLIWRVYGEAGEVSVHQAEGTFLHVGYPQMEIKVHNMSTGDVETVDWQPNDVFEGLPMAARNVGRLYEAFADGQTSRYADWDHALQRHIMLEQMQKSSDSGRPGQYR